MVSAVREPRKISLSSSSYILRTLETSDDCTAWCKWLEDPETARLLNTQPVKLSPDDFVRYVQGFDHVNDHLLGIFRRDTNVMAGLWAIYIDWQHSYFLLNLIIGNHEDRNKGARLETADLVHRYFFEEMGLLSARCTAVGSNEQIQRILEKKQWRLERRDSKPSMLGDGSVEILTYSLPRDVWRRRPR